MHWPRYIPMMEHDSSRIWKYVYVMRRRDSIKRAMSRPFDTFVFDRIEYSSISGNIKRLYCNSHIQQWVNYIWSIVVILLGKKPAVESYTMEALYYFGNKWWQRPSFLRPGVGERDQGSERASEAKCHPPFRAPAPFLSFLPSANVDVGSLIASEIRGSPTRPDPPAEGRKRVDITSFISTHT